MSIRHPSFGHHGLIAGGVCLDAWGAGGAVAGGSSSRKCSGRFFSALRTLSLRPCSR